MQKWAVLLGGDIEPTPRLKAQVAGRRVIAADSGMRHAATLGLDAELWLGDFDSADEALRARYRNVPRKTYPIEKDRTDGEIALDRVLAHGPADIVLVGALGGQSDHALALQGLALAAALRGNRILLASGNEEAVPVVPGATAFDTEAGWRWSFVPWSGISSLGVENVKWPLADRKLDFGSSLTLSNVAQGRVSLRIADGCGMAFYYPA